MELSITLEFVVWRGRVKLSFGSEGDGRSGRERILHGGLRIVILDRRECKMSTCAFAASPSLSDFSARRSAAEQICRFPSRSAQRWTRVHCQLRMLQESTDMFNVQFIKCVLSPFRG
jgi:hypothetical protein